MNKSKLKLLLPCYYAFFVSGGMVLLVGAILPHIIEEAGINYSVAGGLLSAFAIGNLFASFVNPPLAAKIGRKATICILSAFIPVMLFVITIIPPVPVLYLAFGLLGIGRGSVSIINNSVVNDNSDGKPAALNILHMVFAIGAFLSPFMTSACVALGFGWRMPVYIIIAGFVIACIGYAGMKLDYDTTKTANKADATQNTTAKPFYRCALFYIMGLLLFLYLGLENCVNGWFVTYFKSMGIMSDAYATNLVSVTWIMVMLGRLITARISAYVNKNKLILGYCIATAIFFVMLIATHNLVVITVAIAGLGLFFAGIYPTTVSSVGNILKGSNTGMSMLLAMAALGGIVTPQVIGIVADYAGMNAAIFILILNAAGMLVTAGINVVSDKNKAKKEPA